MFFLIVIITFDAVVFTDGIVGPYVLQFMSKLWTPVNQPQIDMQFHFDKVNSIFIKSGNL